MADEKRRTVRRRTTAAPQNGVLPQGPQFDKDVKQAVVKIAVQEEARRRLSTAKAGPPFAYPRVGQTLADDLRTPPRSVKYRVKELLPAGGNALLVAQHKAGKTTLALNLARALADGIPFLGHFEVAPLDGRLAFLNYELDEDMFREWAGDLCIKHPERIARPLHLRGSRLPFWLPEAMEELADWLRRNEVEFLVIDPAARAWSGFVETENDNTQVGRFTDALDELKRAAGVGELLLATHTGRARMEEDEERARGATRLEDWMDAGWYLTKNKEGTRYLRAMGRDVETEAVELQFDEPRRRLTTTGQTRRESRESDGIQAAVDALVLIEQGGGDAPTTNVLTDAMEGDNSHRNKWIKAAEAAGFIERERRGQSKVCRLTDEGRALHGRRIEVER